VVKEGQVQLPVEQRQVLQIPARALRIRLLGLNLQASVTSAVGMFLIALWMSLH
jgi:hypothetical protein